jgi:hypothetical protein
VRTLIALVLAVLLALYWGLLLALSVRAIRRVPRLDEARPLDPTQLPLLTVLVPAKDEAATIETALRAKLSSDYPNLEVIVLDDRSSDGTGDIARRVAAGDARVRVLRIDTLPDGWLGKVHALDQGMRVARGEWVVMSDADVVMSPRTLGLAMAKANDADFLALLPHFEHGSLALDALVHDFIRVVTPFADAPRIADPTSSLVVGGGIFNLVRRSAYDKTPGLQWLKLEIVDDMAFAQMMKQAGARCCIADASRDVRLLIYPTVASFLRGMTKGAWPVFARFNALRLFLATAAALTVHLGPLALLAVPSPFTRGFAATALILSIAGAWVSNRYIGRRALPSLFVPIAGAVTALAMCSTGLAQGLRGGVMWRGTFYPSAKLREGQRLKFPLPWDKMPPRQR